MFTDKVSNLCLGGDMLIEIELLSEHVAVGKSSLVTLSVGDECFCSFPWFSRSTVFLKN